MAITNIAWNKQLRLKFKYDKTGGIIFKNLNTLFGLVMTNEELIISNNPSTDKRRGGVSKCPIGHPSLTRFCGIPFFINEEFIGMVGIANSPTDYQNNITQKYEPFFKGITIC